MNYSKWLLVTLSALAVAACGGDGDDNGSGGGDGGGGAPGSSTTVPYYTLDYSSTDAVTQEYKVEVPDADENVESITIRLGNSDVTARRGENGTPVFDGYRTPLLIALGGGGEGGIMLCKEGDPQSPIWHAILPANATAVGGTVDNKLDKLKGKRFNFYEECESTDEVFVFDQAGNLSFEENGVPVPDEGETAEIIKNILSDAGETRTEDGETITSWLRVYEDAGKVFAVIIDKVEPAVGAATFEIMIIAEQEALPV